MIFRTINGIVVMRCCTARNRRADPVSQVKTK
jgi:hypothetical protein